MPIGGVSLPFISTGTAGGQADFSVDLTTIEPSDTVQFTDLTTDITPTSWEWDFGDGETSTLQNPSHRYKFSGQFTVTLKASDGTTTVFEQKEQYIDCSSPDWIVTIDTRITYDPIRNESASTPDNQFRLSVSNLASGSGKSQIIDWGDGTQQTIFSPGVSSVVHTYATPGIYKVKLLTSSNNPDAPNTGALVSQGLDNTIKIIEFNNWGSGILYGVSGTNYRFASMRCIFYATDKPSNSVLGGNQLFRNTDWELTPQGCYLDNFFDGINPPITTNGVNQMFRNAGFGFNSNLDNIIYDSSDPSVTAKTTNFAFEFCTRFNQPLSHWIMDDVTAMQAMFSGATRFDQDISMWNVNSCTSFASMFLNARSFNQDISTWNIHTSSTVGMESMFNGARSFNQDISSWNTSNVDSKRFMFQNATSFNQNLGAWDLRVAGTNHQQIFTSSGMSTENYTDTIVGWANYVFDNSGPVNVNMASQTGMTFTNSRPGGVNFADAQAARAYLASQGWTISGDTIVA